MAVGDSLLSSLSVSGLKTTAALLVVTLAAVKVVSMVVKRRYNLPPGPRGLPLVGFLPFFGKDPALTFLNLRKTYGDVISITLGSFPAIVINGREVIREALVTKGDDFSGRPAFTVAQNMDEGKNFAFSLFGPVQKMHRKIVSNVIYTFTNARNNPIEDLIRNEGNAVVEEFLAHGDAAFCPMINLEVAAASIMYQVCFGTHKNIREDHAFVSVLDGSRQFERFARAGNPVDVMPWLRFIMPWKLTQVFDIFAKDDKLREVKVEERLKEYDADNLRDVLDGLIHAGDGLSAQERAAGLDEARIVNSVATVYGAGASTVASTLQWGVCLMAGHPDLQDRVFRQIDAVVGPGRPVRLSDRAAMPLVEAALYEVLRFSTALRFALPHAATRDTSLQGYDVPEGTVVLVNLHSIFMDRDLWGDPENFRPERFLTSEGALDKALVEQVSTFSMGRRRCLGEQLARTMLFLFFSTALQRLRFHPPPGHPGYTYEGINGLNYDIVPYDVCVAARE